MTDKEPKNATLKLGHLAEDISFATRVLRTRVARENASFFTDHGVASGEVALLSLIGINPGTSQKELADAVVLKKSALTKAVNEMEKSGLIERSKGSDDKRFNTLHLTPKGEEKWETMRRDMARRQDKLLAPLSPIERKELFRMLWQLSSESEKLG
jgi:DNA-binding MarR family transcriptional regulator